MNENIMTLYPSNWLYNAGLIGLLRILNKMNLNVDEFLNNDGSINLDLNPILGKDRVIEINNFNMPSLGYYWLMESWNVLPSKKAKKDGKIEKEDSEKIKAVWGTLFNVYYRGFFDANSSRLYPNQEKSDNTQKKDKDKEPLIKQFISYLNSLGNENKNKIKCSFCLKDSNANYKNYFTSEHSRLLGASSGEKGVPNSFWNLNFSNSLPICDFCSFVIISNHLAFTRFSYNSEIFINAPSFKVMYELNKLVREIYSSKNKEELKNKREIFATSIIEYSRKIQTTLGLWTAMNLEIVIKNEEGIDFFSLPEDVIKIISDRNIASILSELGEFKILNLILDKKYNQLLDYAYKILKLSSKESSSINKNDKNILNNIFYQDKNRNNLTQSANKLLKLYSLIEEKIKRRDSIWIYS